MEGATGKNCGACSSTEVHNLFCELLDESTTYARALAIREHIAQCDFCQQRLEREELVRSLVRNLRTAVSQVTCTYSVPTRFLWIGSNC